MLAESAFAITRDFVILTGLLVVIKNLAWCGELAAIHLRGDDFYELSHKKHITDEWVVRAGSVLIALAALFGLIVAAVEHVVRWLNPTPLTLPFAFASLVCIQTLLVWRLLYFAKRPAMMIGSIACLALLSILVEVLQ